MNVATSDAPRKNRSRPLSARLHPLFKKIHAYLGLLNLSIILVWGLVGLYELTAPPQPAEPPVSAEWAFDYKAPANASDQTVARALQDLIKPSPGAPPNARRDPNGNLIVTFYSNTNITRALVSEPEGVVRVKKYEHSLGRYLSNLHATTTQDVDERYVALRLWSYFTELSIWSLLLLSLSGLLMWLMSRPRYRPAQVSFVAATGLFVTLYILVR